MLHQSHSILPWLINNTKRYWNSSTWAKVHQRPGVGTPADSKGLRLGAHSQHNHFTFGYRVTVQTRLNEANRTTSFAFCRWWKTEHHTLHPLIAPTTVQLHRTKNRTITKWSPANSSVRICSNMHKKGKLKRRLATFNYSSYGFLIIVSRHLELFLTDGFRRNFAPEGRHRLVLALNDEAISL